jgi:CHASE3 domain sensor protein
MRSKTPAGFTLVVLVVMISVIAALIALSMLAAHQRASIECRPSRHDANLLRVRRPMARMSPFLLSRSRS